MTLYEINEAIANFEFSIDEETGEILNAMQLDELNMARDVKAENVALFIKNLKAEAEAIKAEEKALATRRKHTERKAQSLTDYLQYCLDGDKLKTAKVAVSYRKSEQVECSDISMVSGEYLRVKEPELDKAKIKKAIKAGEEVAGCSLVEKQNIQIK